MENTPPLDWSNGNVFTGVINHILLFGSPIDKPGVGRYQENITYWSANNKVWWRRDKDLGLFFSVEAGFVFFF